MLHTTFNKLYDAGVCEGAYRRLAKNLGGIKKYGRNTPIPLSFGLDNGFDFHDEVLWALRACLEQDEANRIGRLFAADCVEHVLHLFESKYPDDKRPRAAIEVARRFAAGEATEKERATAWAAEAAARAARAAAGDAWAARAAARAARAAAGDAWAAAGDAEAAAWAARAAAGAAWAAWAAEAAARATEAAAWAAWAAEAAARATRAAARAAEIEWQTDRFRRLLDHRDTEDE